MRDARGQRVVIVTGAAGGIGASICEAVLEQGWSCLGVDRRAGPLVNLVADLSDPDEVRGKVEPTLEQQGPQIFGLVNAAGVGFREEFLDSTDQSWLAVLEANLMSTVRMSRSVIRIMLKSSGNRSIVNFGSQAGKTGGIVIGAHYSAAKAAVMCLTKSLAAAYGPDGIRVNAVAPGVIETSFLDEVPSVRELAPRIPLRRLGTPDDVAQSVIFLLSEQANYITGEILDVNGGLLMD